MATRQRQNASSSLWHLVMLGSLANSPLLVTSAQAHTRGLYVSKAETKNERLS
jgi:hypothetical protein